MSITLENVTCNSLNPVITGHHSYQVKEIQKTNTALSRTRPPVILTLFLSGYFREKQIFQHQKNFPVTLFKSNLFDQSVTVFVVVNILWRPWFFLLNRFHYFTDLRLQVRDCIIDSPLVGSLQAEMRANKYFDTGPWG